MEQHCSENTSKVSPTDFYEWFHELESYSLRSERFYEDILNYMYDDADDCSRKALKCLTGWLEAAYNSGKESTKSLDKNSD